MSLLPRIQCECDDCSMQPQGRAAQVSSGIGCKPLEGKEGKQQRQRQQGWGGQGEGQQEDAKGELGLSLHRKAGSKQANHALVSKAAVLGWLRSHEREREKDRPRQWRQVAEEEERERERDRDKASGAILGTSQTASLEQPAPLLAGEKVEDHTGEEEGWRQRKNGSAVEKLGAPLLIAVEPCRLRWASSTHQTPSHLDSQLCKLLEIPSFKGTLGLQLQTVSQAPR